MKRYSVLALVWGLWATASAHVGSIVVPVYELPSIDAIDVLDGHVDDWHAIADAPSLTATDFLADPTVGDGAQYDPGDLDFRIWMGWLRSPARIYLGIERLDDVHVSAYEAGGDARAHDGVELSIDGDHSGGRYAGWPGDDARLYQQAQTYFAVPAPPGNALSWPDADVVDVVWPVSPPFGQGAGAVRDGARSRAVVEFFITPFDSLVRTNPEESVISTLLPGAVVGLQIAVPDFDTHPGAYHAFHSINGNYYSFHRAENFVDGQLIPSQVATVTQPGSWASIKASFRLWR